MISAVVRRALVAPAHKLLGLYSHGRQAGKNTAADFIREECERRGRTCELLAFADLPKLLVAEILGVQSKSGLKADTVNIIDAFKLYGRVDVYLDALEPGPGLYDSITGRDFIINLAGELGVSHASGARKLFGETFWTDQLLPLDWAPRADMTVVTDVRSEEEAYRIHHHNGLVVQIVNFRAREPGGRSEQGLSLDVVDQVVHNSGSLEDLRIRCGYLMQLIWGVHV